ncbi:MAG: hypothetical protein LBS63_00390, partial [Prevotellaceae bacterium]|nr:hypothetical protein [Prevotellaceae bacterium]
ALPPADHALLLSVADDLLPMGLELRDFGSHTVAIQAIPAAAQGKNPQALIEELLAVLKSEEKSLRDNHRHALALSMATSMAIAAGKTLGEEEMRSLVTRLLACASPDICPNGKPTMTIVEVEELDKRLLKT